MSESFDDVDRINLALNTDFDSALLNSLDGENDDTLGETSDFSHSPAHHSSPLQRLPSFLMNDGGTGDATNNGNSNDDDNMASTGASPLHQEGDSSDPDPAMPDTAAVAAGASAPIPASQYFPNNTGMGTAPQMHPLAIPSSASCPPVNEGGNAPNGAANSGTNNNNSFTMPLPGLVDPNMVTALQAAFATSVMQLNSANPAFNPALIPLAFNAMAAGVDLSNFIPQFQVQTPANNTGTTSNNNVAMPAAPMPPMASASVPPLSSITAHCHEAKAGIKSSNKSGHKTSKRRRSSQGSSNSNNKRSKLHASSQPPFHIFDAPVELRQNFIQAQRAHGMPVLEDNNSYHFGMTVNGFHPQRSLEEPFMYKSLSSKRPLPDPVPVVDARHADAGSKRLKNAKEQKRAHRISELIDQLRVKMEKGGWKVGIKSKFHTLSSYVYRRMWIVDVSQVAYITHINVSLVQVLGLCTTSHQSQRRKGGRSKKGQARSGSQKGQNGRREADANGSFRTREYHFEFDQLESIGAIGKEAIPVW